MWNLLLSDDERMIADSVREFMSREMPLERLRPNAPKGRDPETVRAEMFGLGWFGVGLPEAAGGSGLGLVEEMLVQRACGRYLASPSTLAAVLGAHVAVHAGDAELAQALAMGERGAALAIPQPGAAGDRSALALDYRPGDLLLAWCDAGMGLYATTGFDATPDACLDDSVTLHVGALDVGGPSLWVPAEQAPLALRAQVLLAAALTGLAEHACELAVEYAKVREQFGRPIGAFQAIKHRCADMGVRWRLAWYQTCQAALKVQAGEPDATLQAASAKLMAADAAHENGRAVIQVHGGIGFQSECDVHWFMKRAHIYDQAGGPIAAQAQRIFAEPSAI